MEMKKLCARNWPAFDDYQECKILHFMKKKKGNSKQGAL